MVDDTQDISRKLKQKILTFENELQIVERFSEQELSQHKNKLIVLLLLRTRIENLLAVYCNQYQLLKTEWEETQRLDELDTRLKAIGHIIAQQVNLEKWHHRVEIKSEHWWWFFEPSVHAWNQYDWVWSGLTIITLALSASFIIGIYSALSIGSGSRIFTTFYTVIQGLGLALIGGGALSNIGQTKVRKILAYLHISPKLHAEIIFASSVVFFVFIFTIFSWLDNYYFNEGKDFYKQGELGEAANAYEKSLALNPDNDKVNGELGKIYESLGNIEKAIPYYMASVNDGKYDSLNDLGRAFINRVNPVSKKVDLDLAQGYLLLGLQRAEKEEIELEKAIASEKRRIISTTKRKCDRQKLDAEIAELDKKLDNFHSNAPCLQNHPPIKKLQECLLDKYDLLYQYQKNMGWAALKKGRYSIAQDRLENAIKYEKKSVELFKERQKLPNPLKNRPPNGLAYCLLANLSEKMGKYAESLYLWDKCKCYATPEFIHSFQWLYQVEAEHIAYNIDSSYVVAGMKNNSQQQQNNPALQPKQCKFDD